MKNYTFFQILATIFLSISSLNAQQTGNISDPYLGISFDIPNGWVGQESGDLFVMGHNTIPGIIIMTMHNSNVQQLTQEAQAGIQDAQSMIFLNLSGPIQTVQKNAVAGTFEGTVEGQAAKAYMIGMENKLGGSGISIVVLAGNTMFTDEHPKIAKQIMKSVRFTKPQTDKVKKEWVDFLANTRVQYMDSNFSGSYVEGGVTGYYESNEKIDLCSQGYFNYYSSSLVSAGNSNINAYSGGQGNGQGSWEITVGAGGTAYLSLHFHNGEVKEYELGWEDNKLYLNGTRYFRTKTGEYAPNCY